MPPVVIVCTTGIYYTKAEQGYIIADDAMKQGFRKIYPKHSKIEVSSFVSCLKEYWVLQCHFLVNIYVEHEGKHARPRGPQSII